ncbi:hypothetical protein Tsubulata_012190 [Turnera subulata]|uniref:Uncharacterized protein n=1 Tax=Turnera subulata TaxID=218843 RepID=A0A9Q0J0A5_9ROSI|nr:hypothetical protein Tsubulata_012190 [Turnera subulata]
MSSPNVISSSFIQQKFQHFSLGILCKVIAISGLILLLLYTLFFDQTDTQASQLFRSFQLQWPASSPNDTTTDPPTNINHIGFIVISSLKSWKYRRPYVESWWRPNVTRGHLFLDKEPTQEFLPWTATSPPFVVNEDVTKLRIYPHIVSDVQVRMFRSILDMYRVGDEGLRWFIMCDDDSIFMVDNLVEVLRKYDHTKYQYIGSNSECVKSNSDFSFDMGFGGAGYALSYPLAQAMATKLVDGCIERYNYLWASDQIAQSCLADVGVHLTIEKGIHQIDLHGDISGLLSSHPPSPFLTLHHLELVDPIFPSMDRNQALNHLMKAAQFDQSRLLQQTICYQRESNRSFSVSWGYSAHIYDNIIPRSVLRKPLETFRPWANNWKRPYYMFNTRWMTNNPCEAPHVFFFRSIEYASRKNQFVTTYARSWPRNLPPCSASGNHSADHISEIRVFSPARTRKTAGVIECCDVEYKAEVNVTDIKIRTCMKDEVIA